LYLAAAMIFTWSWGKAFGRMEFIHGMYISDRWLIVKARAPVPSLSMALYIHSI